MRVVLVVTLLAMSSAAVFAQRPKPEFTLTTRVTVDPRNSANVQLLKQEIEAQIQDGLQALRGNLRSGPFLLTNQQAAGRPMLSIQVQATSDFMWTCTLGAGDPAPVRPIRLNEIQAGHGHTASERVADVAGSVVVAVKTALASDETVMGAILLDILPSKHGKTELDKCADLKQDQQVQQCGLLPWPLSRWLRFSTFEIVADEGELRNRRYLGDGSGACDAPQASMAYLQVRMKQAVDAIEIPGSVRLTRFEPPGADCRNPQKDSQHGGLAGATRK